MAGADLEGSYYQSRIECIWPQAMLGVCAGGGRAFRVGGPGYYPGEFYNVRMYIFGAEEAIIIARKTY